MEKPISIDILNYKLTDIPLDIYADLYIETKYNLELFNNHIILDNKCVVNKSCDCHKTLEIAKKISDEIINVLEYMMSNKNKIYRIIFLKTIGVWTWRHVDNWIIPQKILNNIIDYVLNNIVYLRYFTYLRIVDKFDGGDYTGLHFKSLTIVFDRNSYEDNIPFEDKKKYINERIYKDHKISFDNIDLKKIHTYTAINLLNDKINKNVEKYENKIQELCDIFKTNNNNLEIINKNKIDNEEIFEYINNFCDVNNIYNKISNMETTLNDKYNELKNENEILKRDNSILSYKIRGLELDIYNKISNMETTLNDKYNELKNENELLKRDNSILSCKIHGLELNMIHVLDKIKKLEYY